MRYHGESQINLLRLIRTNILLRNFTGELDDIYRAIHFFINNQFFFSQYPKYFFLRTHVLVLSGQIKKVKRLLVFSTNEDIGASQSQRIIKFHTLTEGYDYECIRDLNYWEIQKKYGIHPKTDIGIFGTKMLYRARLDKPDWVIGTWTKNPNEIADYTNFFEECWESNKLFKPYTISAGESFTLDDLFKE